MRPGQPEPLSAERQHLLGIGEDIHRLAAECTHPLPFKQENLDLIRGNFAQLGNICIGLVEVLTLQLERIEALEAHVGKAKREAETARHFADRAVSDARARGMS